MVYVQELANPATPEFKNLATKVEKEFDEIYRAQFGPRFLRTVVKAFIAISKTRADQNVQAQVDIIFNQASTEPVPTSTAVVNTLKEAAANPSSGLNLTVDVATISVIKSVQLIPLTILTNGTFVAAFSNTSSAEFQSRASLLKTELEPFFIADYPGNFSVLTLTKLSSVSSVVKAGSVATIQNTMDVTFVAEATLPNATQIVNTVVRAAKNNTISFQIFTNQIIVNNTAYSSAEVSQKISVLVALLLAAVSLLLPQLH